MTTGVMQKLGELDKALHDFKEADDRRYKDLKENGVESPILRAEVDKANQAVTKVSEELAQARKEDQKRLDDMEAALNRQDLTSKDNTKVAEGVARFYSVIEGRNVDPSEVDVDEYRAYRKAYEDYLRNDRDGVSPENMQALQDIKNRFKATGREGSDPDGGYFVPDEMDSEITRRIFRTSPMRQVATVRPIGTEAYTFLISDTQASSGGWVEEQGTSSETNTPTYRKARVPAHKQFAEPRLTTEILEDAMISIESELSEKIAEILGQTENTAFVSGNGVGKPRGFLDYSTSASNEDDSPRRAWGTLQHVATGTSAGFGKYSGTTADESGSLIDLQTELHSNYRAGASWMMNRGTLATVRKLRDADGNYLWERNFQAGMPFTLLGSPVIEAEDMPDIAADSLSIAYGDFRQGYIIVQRRGINVLRDPYTTKGVVKYYTTVRVGGDVKNVDAIKLLKFGTS